MLYNARLDPYGVDVLSDLEPFDKRPPGVPFGTSCTIFAANLQGILESIRSGHPTSFNELSWTSRRESE
ncbi:hypothetical protein TgHK011_001838 [Trichoderma gracile]|nr:hypothetical protein TgHK011_001838 [Trichoderma gracile]